MSDSMQLTRLRAGQKAVISQLTAFDDMRRRLQDIGLIEGTVVECVGKSPLGDPAAFLIRGAVIALRSEDSDSVLITLLEEEESFAGHRRGILSSGGDMASAEISQPGKAWRKGKVSALPAARQKGKLSTLRLARRKGKEGKAWD